MSHDEVDTSEPDVALVSVLPILFNNISNEGGTGAPDETRLPTMVDDKVLINRVSTCPDVYNGGPRTEPRTVRPVIPVAQVHKGSHSASNALTGTVLLIDTVINV